jgi:hypothetical protein
MTPDQPIPAADLSIAELDARMQAAGMFPLSEMLKNIPLAQWITHASVKDMASFESWLHVRRAEMLRMHATMDVDKRHSDDMYEWVVAHSAVFTEVLCNLQAAQRETIAAAVQPPTKEQPDCRLCSWYSYGDCSRSDGVCINGNLFQATAPVWLISKAARAVAKASQQPKK